MPAVVPGHARRLVPFFLVRREAHLVLLARLFLKEPAVFAMHLDALVVDAAVVLGSAVLVVEALLVSLRGMHAPEICTTTFQDKINKP